MKSRNRLRFPTLPLLRNTSLPVPGVLALTRIVSPTANGQNRRSRVMPFGMFSGISSARVPSAVPSLSQSSRPDVDDLSTRRTSSLPRGAEHVMSSCWGSASKSNTNRVPASLPSVIQSSLKERMNHRRAGPLVLRTCQSLKVGAVLLPGEGSPSRLAPPPGSSRRHSKPSLSS